MSIVRRFITPPQGSFFLFGPRGTGKSLWVRTRFPQALHLDLLQPDLQRTLRANPERLRDLIRGTKDRAQVVLDEVQRAPEVLEVIHSLIEDRSKPTTQFILTSSSSRKLKRAGVDLLAGRAVLRTMHPYMAAELGDRFSLEAALHNGLVPLVVEATDPADVLRSYAALYLREEVQTEGLVRNIGSFARFLEAISFSHASVLNQAEVGRECQVGRKTVEGYLEVLEDLLLSFRVPVFTRRAQRQTVSHPKFFFFDAGVFRSLRPAGPLDRPEEIEGAALEGLVAQHLRALLAYSASDDRLYYWRTRTGLEVDFIVYGPGGLKAIEVKNSNKVRPEDLRGLLAFKEEYPMAEARLVYRGSEKLDIRNILCQPVDEYLKSVAP